MKIDPPEVIILEEVGNVKGITYAMNNNKDYYGWEFKYV